LNFYGCWQQKRKQAGMLRMRRSRWGSGFTTPQRVALNGIIAIATTTITNNSNSSV